MSIKRVQLFSGVPGRLVTVRNPKRGFKVRFVSHLIQHRKPVLNQMIRETRFEAPFWIKWLAKRALKPRFESNDSRNALWIHVLNQMTRETRFESPFWIKWLAKRALNPRSEPNDSRNALWIPVLNQMTRETRFESTFWTKWLAKRALNSPVLNQMTRETRFEDSRSESN